MYRVETAWFLSGFGNKWSCRKHLNDVTRQDKTSSMSAFLVSIPCQHSLSRKRSHYDSTVVHADAIMHAFLV